MSFDLPTGNLNNKLNDRPCVRQSRFYRQYESGNSMKDIMGQGNLKWNETKKEGVFNGKPAYDSHQHVPEYSRPSLQSPPSPPYHAAPAAPAPAPRAFAAPPRLTDALDDDVKFYHKDTDHSAFESKFAHQQRQAPVQTTSTRVNANAAGNPITWEGDAGAPARRGRKITPGAGGQSGGGYHSPVVAGAPQRSFGAGPQQQQQQQQRAGDVGGRNGGQADVAGRGRDFSHQKSYVSTSLW